MTLKPDDENLEMTPDEDEAATEPDEADEQQQSEHQDETPESLETEAPASAEQPDEAAELEQESEDDTPTVDDSIVEFDGDRPVVNALEYQAPKGKPAAEEETEDTRFSSVAEARAVIEGFLFSCNEPLSVSKLAKLMGNLHPKTVRGLLLELQWEYENRPGALQVVEIAGGYQLCTRPFIAPWMFRMHKHKRRSALSPATLETLAIVAYRQPITRGEIEVIRGVETGAPLRTLQDLGMVEASGRREVIGRPQLYVTTEQFLKTFGLKSVGDLPSISELKSRFSEEQKLKAAIAEKPEPEVDPERLPEAEPKPQSTPDESDEDSTVIKENDESISETGDLDDLEEIEEELLETRDVDDPEEIEKDEVKSSPQDSGNS